MTCVVGIRTETGVLLGADSLAATGSAALVRDDPKVFRMGERLAAGFAGSYRVGQVLQHHVTVADPLVGDSIREWVVTVFVPALRQRLKDTGAMRRFKDEQERGADLLLAAYGRLLRVNEDFQVVEPAYPFAACGSGEAWALGALYATDGAEVEGGARGRLEIALEAAQEFSTDVRGPFSFVEVSA